MIDVHCHLEQKDYDKDRDAVIEECKKELKAVVDSSPYLPHFKRAVEMHRKYKNFVFISLAIHPIYVEKVKEADIEKAVSFIKENEKEISAIGETGLDYYHVKDEALRKKQQYMFLRFVEVAAEIDKPLVVHCRDAFDDCIRILEEKGMKGKRVMMHLYSSRRHLQKVIEGGWSISVGPSIGNSKDIKKIVRDMPLDRIMLETDSPWFGKNCRNTPLSIRYVAERIAQVKKIPFEDVWLQAGRNAVEFFRLPLKI